MVTDADADPHRINEPAPPWRLGQRIRWFAELNNNGSFDVWDESGLAHIAAVSTGLLPDPTGGQHARLIAMAPTLLAHIRQAVGNCETCRDWSRRCLRCEMFLRDIEAIDGARRENTGHA